MVHGEWFIVNGEWFMVKGSGGMVQRGDTVYGFLHSVGAQAR